MEAEFAWFTQSVKILPTLSERAAGASESCRKSILSSHDFFR